MKIVPPLVKEVPEYEISKHVQWQSSIDFNLAISLD